MSYQYQSFSSFSFVSEQRDPPPSPPPHLLSLHPFNNPWDRLVTMATSSSSQRGKEKMGTCSYAQELSRKGLWSQPLCCQCWKLQTWNFSQRTFTQVTTAVKTVLHLTLYKTNICIKWWTAGEIHQKFLLITLDVHAHEHAHAHNATGRPWTYIWGCCERAFVKINVRSDIIKGRNSYYG